MRTLRRRKDLGVCRDGFWFLGRTRIATKSLKGRLAVAQPPGATMAVTEKQVTTRRSRSKDERGKKLDRIDKFTRSHLSRVVIASRLSSHPEFALHPSTLQRISAKGF